MPNCTQIETLNPALRPSCNSPAIGDIQSAYQIQVCDSSAGTVTNGVISYSTVRDPGKISFGSHQAVYPSNATGSVTWMVLVVRYMYRWQIKTRDTTGAASAAPPPGVSGRPLR